MKTIGIHLQKGGCGKSTITGNLGYAISLKQKVMLIDADPQGNLSSWFLTQSPKHELSDILQGKVDLSEAMVKIKDNLFIIPTFAIGGTLKNYSEGKLVDEPFIFEDLTKEIDTLNFDIIIFDMSPGMSRLEKCVLLACQEVLTPLTPEFFSLDGIEIFNSELQKLNKSYRKNIIHDKIIVNSINYSFTRHKIIYDKIIQLTNYKIFTIGQDSKLAESQLNNQTIFDYNPSSKTIPELLKIANAIIEN